MLKFVMSLHSLATKLPVEFQHATLTTALVTMKKFSTQSILKPRDAFVNLGPGLCLTEILGEISRPA